MSTTTQTPGNAIRKFVLAPCTVRAAAFYCRGGGDPWPDSPVKTISCRDVAAVYVYVFFHNEAYGRCGRIHVFPRLYAGMWYVCVFFTFDLSTDSPAENRMSGYLDVLLHVEVHGRYGRIHALGYSYVCVFSSV